jgi:hypothetical protein
LLDVVGGGLGDPACDMFAAELFGGVILGGVIFSCFGGGGGGVLSGLALSSLSLAILALWRFADSSFSAVPLFLGSRSPESWRGLFDGDLFSCDLHRP